MGIPYLCVVKLVTYSDIHRRIQEDTGYTKYIRKHKKK